MYIEIYWLGPIDPETGFPSQQGGRYQIENLSLAPQTDLTGDTLPVNEYTCDVITRDDIPGTLPPEAGTCRLYDERDLAWVYWPIRKSIRVSPTCVHITCTSWLSLLDYIQMAETVYEGETAETVVAGIFPVASDYTLANSLKSVQISGYAPAQTARERLTWVLFAIGGYVRDIYSDRLNILKVDTTETLIPLEHTFMRPSIDRAAWVTALKITTYSFFEAASDEAAAEYDNSYMFPLPWVATENTVTLTNPDAPEEAPENVVEIDGIYLINSGNVSSIASRLAKYWFNPTEASLDCINNRKYRPGDLVTVCTTPEDMLTGYIQQESFRFGKQARSTLKLIGCETRASAVLTVNYRDGTRRIAQDKYRLPVGFGYEIEARYIDEMRDGHEYVYRPTTATISGTMPDNGATVNVACEVALDLYQGILHIISVDEVDEQSSGGETIGVIA